MKSYSADYSKTYENFEGTLHYFKAKWKGIIKYNAFGKQQYFQKLLFDIKTIFVSTYIVYINEIK